MSLMPDTLKTRTIFHGQVLEQLAKIPSGKINCSVTSPPYYHVRDYDFDGQWGQEKDPSMFLEHLAQFMQAMHRVTSKHGTVWVNIGDVMVKENWYGFPERFYVNALNAGWKSVSKVVWMKRNAMPSSTGKRFSPKWEPIYGFAKNDDYYFDKSKVLIPTTTPVKPFNYRVREGISGKLQKKFGNQYSATEKEKREHNKKGEKNRTQSKKEITLNSMKDTIMQRLQQRERIRGIIGTMNLMYLISLSKLSRTHTLPRFLHSCQNAFFWHVVHQRGGFLTHSGGVAQ